MSVASPTPPRILFVEGPDDKHVIRHICFRHKISLSFDIKDKGGVKSLLRTMEAEVRVPDRRVVGFVVDANDAIMSRWQSMRNRLERVGVRLPDELQLGGAIVNGNPRVGVWMMPNNSSAGELEDFVETMIPDGDPVLPLAKKYISSIPQKHRKFKAKQRRAEVYAWLATRGKPGRMGTAIRAGDLETSGELCLRFSKWIRDLFE